MRFHSPPAKLFAAGLVALATAGCLGGGPSLRSAAPEASVPEAPAQPVAGGPALGNGPVKVALLLPLTGPGSNAAAALRNAAEMSLQEASGGGDLTILVKDDRGTPEGAREAAEQAVAEGAELILGPLFAASVQGAGAVARQAGRPIVAFSTDASVASRGVYLLSLLPQSSVDRIVDHAADQGRRSIAALVPETTYGNLVEAQFREAAARRSLRVAAIERYAPGQPQAAVQRLAPIITGGQADALFIPDDASGVSAVGQALAQIRFDPARVKPLGTNLWDSPQVLRQPALQGGWFAAPDPAPYAAFAERYRARFGGEPSRLSTLSFDGVRLALALNRQYGSQRFADQTLTTPAGFAGTDGVFRFRADGTSERALAVLEIRNGAAVPVSPAPRSLGASGT